MTAIAGQHSGNAMPGNARRAPPVAAGPAGGAFQTVYSVGGYEGPEFGDDGTFKHHRHRSPPRRWAYDFPRVTTFSASMSRWASASSFFSRQFSASGTDPIKLSVAGKSGSRSKAVQNSASANAGQSGLAAERQ